MFDWFRNRFRPTIIEVTIEPEDPIQDGVDMVADGINYLLKNDYPADCMSELLHQMGNDVATLHETRQEDNVIYPVFPQT